MALRSILFIIIGAIYLINPHLISRWLWSKSKTPPSEVVLKRYILIMRIVGGVLIAVGILLAVIKK
jgi:hypothetical protein